MRLVRGKGHLARHDETAGLFPAFGETLFKNELIGAGLGYHDISSGFFVPARKRYGKKE